MAEKNILLLTPQMPYPPQQGTSLRNWHILRGLAQHNQVSLLSFVESDQSAAALQPLLTICPQVRTVPVPVRDTALRLRQLLTTRLPDMAHRLYHPLFAETLRQWLQETPFAVVQVEGIELARYIPLIRQVSPASRILFDDHNAEAELQWRNCVTDSREPKRWPAAAYSLIQTLRLRRFEREAMRQADWVVAVSEQDAAHLHRLLPWKTLTVIPNSLDIEAYQAVTDSEAANAPAFDLIFTGKMDYRPNVDAVLWFAETVWPQIRAARPQTTWAIVGQKPHERLNVLNQQPGITLTGWVESVTPYLAGAKVCLLPFRAGSGTRLKLIEAMAAGKAIVSTTVGAEGFPVRTSQELILADEPERLAQVVLYLLADEGARQRLGAAARVFAQEYDWRVVVPRFEQLYEAE